MKLVQYCKTTNPLALIFLLYIGVSAVCNLPTFFQQESLSSQEGRSIKDGIYSLETEFNDKFWGKEAYILLNGGISNSLGAEVLNGVVKLKNGYFETLDRSREMNVYINSAITLKDYLEEKDIPFVYVQAPDKIPTDDDEMIPVGFENYVNRNADNLLEGLEKGGIPILDLRESVLEEGIDHYSLFFKTDNHWTPEGGFWAHRHVAEFIDVALKESIANPYFYDFDLYEKQVYEEVYLGSWGQRAGATFTGYDDVTIISPTFETELIFETPSLLREVTGDFKEVVFYEFDERNINYGSYLPNLMEYSVVTNRLATNDKKIFILRDSFSQVLAPFLALHYSEIHLFDLRGNPEENSNLFLEKIEEIQPDIVVQLIYTKSVGNDALYSYSAAIDRKQAQD